MKSSRRILFAVVGLLLLAVLYGLYRYAIDSPYRVSSDDAKKQIKNREIDVILDVRTDAELRLLGLYPGSVHVQSGDLEDHMAREYPDKTIRILLYCNTGQRARAATEKLRGLGYVNAVYIAGPYQSLL
jgi:rhodanese-related sulfurtransferase